MKYGQHLRDNIAPEYGSDPYLDYGRLDDIIRILSGKAQTGASQGNRQVSLTTPPPTDARGVPEVDTNMTEEVFYREMDAEMAKVESFTLAEVTKLRKEIAAIDKELQLLGTSTNDNENDIAKEADALEARADEVAECFLRLEKYVNINFMGFHKILKKHDKHAPTNPCKSFYVNRMHSQAWVRGDYSDVVVHLSSIYSTLRRDTAAKETQDASQSFLRSTTKYWVKTEDVSRVKYAILRNLPVFLQKTSTGESDSQLTNSVYLDNDQLELYHGRLDKSPGAQAVRLRWYGAADPKTVFVERKTHREKWTGEVSVKERFIIDESEVQQVMNDTYPIAEKKIEMMEKRGASQEEADEWEILAREVTQVISSKQLVPTMRTQYMRTAFQIPFDATVRVSLDTNLCMISERGYDLKDKTVWHRDSSKTLAPNEITRFPHAVLEIKLELKAESGAPPQWVSDLQNSGLLFEVHKFSKFIHGCSVLLPEDVQSVPYWIDDASLRNSILESGAERILVPEAEPLPNQAAYPPHLLPFGHTDAEMKTATGRTAANLAAALNGAHGERKSPRKGKTPNYGGYHFYGESVPREGFEEDDENVYCGCEEDTNCVACIAPFCSYEGGANAVVAPTSVQKVEPKVFFANERTFLHWLHAGVTLFTISSGILAFAAEDAGNGWAHWYAMMLLPISLAFCLYALHIFLWRADRIRTRVPGRWDDPRGPLLLGGVVVLVLFVNFCLKCYAIIIYDEAKAEL